MQCLLHPLYKGKKKQGLRYSSIIGCICDVIYQETTRLSHMLSSTKTYTTWADMKHRCNSPDHKSAKHYYYRGITYEDRWEIFDNFLEDMGCKPPNTHLDRINNDLGYTKNNCRWATIRQSQLNKRFKDNKDKLPKGIRIIKGGGYNVRAKLKYMETNLGTFKTLEEAIEARYKWEIEHAN